MQKDISTRSIIIDPELKDKLKSTMEKMVSYLLESKPDDPVSKTTTEDSFKPAQKLTSLILYRFLTWSSSLRIKRVSERLL